MSTTIPGVMPPTDAQALYNALVLAIGQGIKVVRFQDRTIEYQSTDDMIKAANFLYGMLPGGPGAGVGAGNGSGGYRQIRFYSNKGL